MKKRLIFCTIMAICAFSIAGAQTTDNKAKTTDQKAVAPAAMIKMQPVTLMQRSAVQPQAAKKDIATTPNKLAPHAPDPNDPNYAAKRDEWVKNYPDEYDKLIQEEQKIIDDINARQVKENTKVVQPQPAKPDTK